MPKNIDVCASWHGNAQESFNFTNQNDQPATVNQIQGETWPFVQSSPITVPAKGQGGPGSTSCQLANLPNGTYKYDVPGCLTAGQAKSVTIP